MTNNKEIILEIVEKGNSIFFTINKESLVIGRDPSADIVLKEDGASKAHCRIDFKKGHGFSVTDLNSKNGTHINNHQVRKSPFYLDDVIQIGESYIRFASSLMGMRLCARLENPNKNKRTERSITLVQRKKTPREAILESQEEFEIEN